MSNTTYNDENQSIRSNVEIHNVPEVYYGSHGGDGGVDFEYNEQLNGERSMWRAVITQALMDASSNSKKPENLKARREARNWLRGNNEDFLYICELADMDPQYVRRKARLALARNCVWRQSPKNKKRREKSKLSSEVMKKRVYA